jgi:hypothetical protein
MAVTLNASSTAGFVTTADTSTILQLQTNGTTAVTVDASQAVTIQGLTVGLGAGAVSTNTAVGASALPNNTTGNQGVFIGAGAGTSNTTGINNVGVGYRSLYSGATTGGQNVGVGSYALYGVTTGANNSGFGQETLQSNTTGSNNVAVGTNALNANTTASNNTAVGYQALYTNTTGTENVAIGPQALYGVTTGYENIGIGRTAGYSLTTGSRNVFVGDDAGTYITTGNNNTIIGRYTGNNGGLDIRTASNYIVLSDGDGNPKLVVDNTNRVSLCNANSPSTTQNGIRAGTGASTQAYFDMSHGATTSSLEYFYFRNSNGIVGSISSSGSTTTYATSSDYRLKENIAPMAGALARISQLKPVTYSWKVDGSAGEGFIAHELQAVVPECVTGEKDAVNEDGSIKAQGIDTSFLVATLTAAIQEQQALITQLQADVAALKGASV